MRFWNTGAEGQVLVGGLAATVCMVCIGGAVPLPVLYILMTVASIAAGAVWGGIPAIFKAKWNTNETLFTLMMNYVAIQLVAFCIDIWVKDGSGTLKPMHELGFPTIGNKWLLNILIIAVITVLIYIYLRFSKQGYEISVVGESENTARYVGINVGKVIVRTMLISGAVCGVAGMLLVSGIDHSVNADTVGGQGFTAIMVSWLGQFNPFIIAFMSALTIFLQLGAGKVADSCRLNSSYADVATGIVILFLVGCEFFIRYSIKFRHSKATKGATE
jgi:simple sugar transport system permease protein